MATIEERFQAAVNVIKGLPKNGPYQPSTTMMLTFYGLYKQATEGPCHQRKPAFWDIVGKAKWDAWNGNSHLTKQQAMQKYVDGLREIIETMSYTENVANFVGTLNGLDNIDLDDLEMIAPGMKEFAESHPGSPFNSRTNSPQHGSSSNINRPSTSKATAANSQLTNGHGIGNGYLEDSAEIASERPPNLSARSTMEQNGIVAPTPTYAAVVSGSVANSVVDQSDDEYGDPVDINADFSEALTQNTEILKQVQAAVLRMNADMASVNHKMVVLEKGLQEVRTALKFKSLSIPERSRGYPKWWPLQHISPGWFVLFLLWPFILRRIARLMFSPKAK